MDSGLGGKPMVIQGRDTQVPGQFGQQAYRKHSLLFHEAQDTFERTENIGPMETVASATIRYTPEGTMKPDTETDEGIANALAYAREDIEKMDIDGDKQVSAEEYLHVCNSNCGHQVGQLQGMINDPAISEAMRAELREYVDNIKDYTEFRAANMISATDLDQNGKVSADELAANIIFTDDAAGNFKANEPYYEMAYVALQEELGADNPLPDFHDLKTRIQQIKATTPSAQAFAQDGQLTAPEREIGELLENSPPVTRSVLQNIHARLGLKEKLASLPTLDQSDPDSVSGA